MPHLRPCYCLLALPLIWASTAIADQTAAPGVDSPVAVDRSLALFQLPPGLEVQLVACEPQVVDPVEIRFDERGRMWVVEMRDYPHGPRAGEKPKSRIRILEDRDGDRRYETAHTFADELLFPTGLQPWRNGVFVTLAGRLDYMQDTDGDLRADRVETWFRGFAEENTQLRANHPRLAVDNHIYIANGLRGGAVVDARQAGAKPVSLRGRDFRFDPRSGRFETMAGMGQFGLTFDDFGRRFVCSNRNPCKHVVIEDRYARTNPHARVAESLHDVAAAGPQSKLFPISDAWTTSNLHAGQFTAACGVTIYRGDALPRDDFYANALTCDPTGSLVHRERMQPLGSTFTSSPAREGIEFLASPDTWFRPVNMTIGPDGALYIVDMYRAVIEHPQFMPEELKRRPDLLLGTDRGRIYRIVPKGFQQPGFASPAGANRKQLLSLLEHPSSWQRETAARLLLERQDKGAASQLAKLATGAESPAARAHALWLLHGMERLTEEHVLGALVDESAGVRETGLRLAESWLARSPKIRAAAMALARDKDPRVRFHVALSFSVLEQPPELTPALQQIARSGLEDRWTRMAVALAAKQRPGELLAGMLQQAAGKPGVLDEQLELLENLIGQVSRRGDAESQRVALDRLLNMVGDGSEMAAAPGIKLLAKLSQSAGGKLTALASDPALKSKLVDTLDRASQSALDGGQPIARRIAAVELLEAAQPSSPAIVQLAIEATAPQLRSRAIAAMRRVSDESAWKNLLEHFPRLSPALRRTLVDASLGQATAARLLLEQVAAGRISPNELDRTAVSTFLKHPDAQIRKTAVKLLSDPAGADRKQVLAEYQSALKLAADADRGKNLFAKHCAQCHRIGDVGVDVAPDISDSRTKQPAQLLADILQPNRAIDTNYVSYSVITADGRVLSGIIAAETAAALTLKQPEGKSITLARDEIDEIRSTGVSLMPDGLEKNLSQQQMADVIAFIKNWRYLDGQVPLGKGD